MGDEVRFIEPRELLRKVRVATFDAAAEARRIAAARAGAAGLSCGKGCARCCHQKVLVTRAEGVAIALQLRASGNLTSVLLARLALEDAEMTAVTHARWMAERRPCVFLARGARPAGEGLCFVHPVRPIGCLSTFSAGDPDQCWVTPPAEGQGQMQVTRMGPAMHSLLAIHVGVERGFAEDGDGPGCWMTTLPGAVLWAACKLAGREPPPMRAIRIGDGGAAGGDATRVFDEVAT
jgi:Fe-S-cluster containining protein